MLFLRDGKKINWGGRKNMECFGKCLVKFFVLCICKSILINIVIEIRVIVLVIKNFFCG